MTVEQPSKEPSGQKVLKSLVALSLSASLCPTAAFAAEGGYSEGDAAQTAQSAQADQAAPSQEITPQASLRATQEVTVGCLKYRIDTASKEACVIEYAVSWSNRPDNIIIPEKIEVGGVDCHTAITWASSNTEVATVKNGAVAVAAGAANGAQSVITATNALGQSASYTVVAQASSAKGIATVAAGQITILDMFKGFVTAPSFAIKDGDYTLVADKDYTVSYETAAGEAIALGDIAAAGTYNMVVTGTGADYQGTLKVPFNVVESLTAGDWKYAQTADGEVAIAGYTGAGAIATAPAKINGFAVTSVAADTFKGAAVAQKIVLPDTITSIDAYAFFGAVSPKVEFLGAAPSVTSGVVTLPSGMKVSYSDTFDGDAFTAVFGSGNTVATKDLWSYRVTLEGSGADVEKSAALEAAQGSAYRGAWGDTLAIDVPSEIDGYAITRLGANAFGQLPQALYGRHPRQRPQVHRRARVLELHACDYRSACIR